MPCLGLRGFSTPRIPKLGSSERSVAWSGSRREVSVVRVCQVVQVVRVGGAAGEKPENKNGTNAVALCRIGRPAERRVWSNAPFGSVASSLPLLRSCRTPRSGRWSDALPHGSKCILPKYVGVGHKGKPPLTVRKNCASIDSTDRSD